MYIGSSSDWGSTCLDTLTLARALNLMGERVKHLTSSGARYTEAADGADELRAPTSRDESQDTAASAFTEASSSQVSLSAQTSYSCYHQIQNNPCVTQTIHIKPGGGLEAETQSSDRRASNRQEPEATVQNADVISDGTPDGVRQSRRYSGAFAWIIVSSSLTFRVEGQRLGVMETVALL